MLAGLERPFAAPKLAHMPARCIVSVGTIETSMPTILLVEDEPTLAETLRYNLEREGYSVLAAGDCVRGLELARREQPDQLILNVSLRRRDVFSVCRFFRQESHVPILIRT